MLKPFEYWKNTFARFGVRVKRRRVKRAPTDLGMGVEVLEQRQVMSIDSPIIAGFSASPTSVPLGNQITLVATGVTDPDGDAISHVQFFRDIDSDGVLTGADGSPLATDTDGSNGWSSSVSTAGFAAGTNRLFAVARDATNLDSNPVAATATILLSPQIIDNGGAGFSLVSSNYWSTSGGGYGGGHQFEFGATGGYAQWTFSSLPAGEYRVSATWPASTSNGTNVPYTIYDGSLDVGSARVNQRVTPTADVVVSSKNFQNLGSVSVVNGFLVIRVTNSSGDGRAIADAVRIEHIGPAQQTSDIRVFDGGTELADGASTVNLGTTFIGTPTASKTFTIKNSGLTDLVLTPLTQAMMPAGITLVSSYGATTLARGTSTTFQVALSATSTGNVSGTLSLPSNDPDEANFGVTLTGVVNASKIIDNGGTGYTTVSNNYWSTSGGAGYQNGYQFEFGATGGYAQWTFPNLLPGAYRVSATWPAATDRGTNVPYTIYGASTNVAAIAVNQRVAPAADVVVGSTNFQNLGTVSVVDGSLVVRVTNSSGDGKTIADAVRIEYIGPAQQTSDIRIFNGSTELADGASTVNLGTTFVGTPSATTTLTVKNGGLSDLVLTPLTQANMPADVTLVSSYGATTLARGESTTFQIKLSATRSGNVSGSLLLMSNDLDEAAFAINLSGVVNASKIIDNGGTGYSTVSSSYWSTSGGGYGGGYQFEFGATGGYAQWTFPNLLRGSYRVSTTWLEASNRGTNVPYTISDGSTNIGTVSVNQRIAPAGDVVVSSSNFQNLSTVSVVNGSIVVRVTNSSGDGRAIADAVRVEYLGPLPPNSTSVTAGFANGRLDIVGTAGGDTVTLGTLTVGGVSYVAVNGQVADSGVRPSDITTIVADLKDGNDTFDLSTLDLVAYSGLTDGSITIYGGAGDDSLTGSPLGDILYGEAGDDTMAGGAGDDYLSGGDGNDAPSGGTGSDTVFGDAGDDTVLGEADNDFVFGGDGQDYVGGGTGDDYLHGDAGDDEVHGAIGKDHVYGDSGADALYGGSGNDSLYGGLGNDLLFARENDDYVGGGVGDDTYRFEAFTATGLDKIDEAPGEGNDVLDVTALTLLNAVNLNTTAVQFLTSYQTLQFVNAGTVETVLGNTTPAYSSTTIDDGDSGFTTVSSQSWTSSTGGYNSDYRFESGATGGYAQWTFSNLPSGQYWVSATWVEGADRGTSVPYTISDGSLALATTNVNQRVAPTAYRIDASRNFQGLGTVSVVNGSLVVRMDNISGDGQAIADAVRIENLGPVLQGSNIRVFNGATELTTVVSTVNLGMTPLGTPTAPTTFTIENTGLSDLVLTPLTQADMPAGVTLVSSFAATTLARGQSTTFQIKLSGTTAGNAGGTLSIWSNALNDQRFEVLLTGVVVGPKVVDDGDAGFMTVSSQSWIASTGGYSNDYRFESGATGGYAEWTFADLPSGEYRVSTTWVEGADRGTNVPYTFTDGVLELGTTSVNQRSAPTADVVISSKNFQNLGAFSVVNGSLVVRMPNTSGDGFAIADAVRIEYLGPLPTGPASFANGRLDIVGTADDDVVTVGTVDLGGVLYVVVNGQTVGTGVRASDVTQLVADLKAGHDTMNLSSLDLSAFTGLADGGVTIKGGEGNDQIQGTPLADILEGDAGDDDIRGNDGDDVIEGGDGADQLIGGNGDDTIRGGSGDDFLDGGADPDHLEGGDGSDEIEGEGGSDTIFGEAGDDFVYGGGDNDILNGGSGADYMAGGEGDDDYVYTAPLGTGLDTIDEYEGDGYDRLDVRTLGLTTFVNLYSTAVQSLGGGPTLQFVTSANVEKILTGHVLSPSSEGVYTVPGDAGDTTHVSFRYGGGTTPLINRLLRPHVYPDSIVYTDYLYPSDTLYTDRLYAYEVDAAGYPVNTLYGPDDQLFDPLVPRGDVAITNGGLPIFFDQPYAAGTRLAFFIEREDGMRFYSMPTMNEDGNHAEQAIDDDSGETIFSWEDLSRTTLNPSGLAPDSDFDEVILGVGTLLADNNWSANPDLGFVIVAADKPGVDENGGETLSFTFTNLWDYSPVDPQIGVIPRAVDRPLAIAFYEKPRFDDPYSTQPRAMATAGLDYSGIPGGFGVHIIVIPEGEHSVTLTLPVINDSDVEGDETVDFGVWWPNVEGYTEPFPEFWETTAGYGFANWSWLDAPEKAFSTITDDDTVDLDIDSDNSGDIDHSLDEELRETGVNEPGKFISIGGALEPMTLDLKPGVSAQVSITSGAEKVRVWSNGVVIPFKAREEGQPAVLDRDFIGSLDTPDVTLWIEALQPSQSAGDIVFKLQDQAMSVNSDTVRLTASAVDLVVDELPEDLENLGAGAIVWRNSDFSRTLEHADPAEPWQPRYIPDYSTTTAIDPEYQSQFTSARATFTPGLVANFDFRFQFDATKIALWTRVNWEGFQEVSMGPDGWWRIPSGASVRPGSGDDIAQLDFWIEGLNTTDYGQGTLELFALPRQDAARLPVPRPDVVSLTVIDVGIGVDGNRDGTIDFADSYDRQLTFWMNNDRDVEADPGFFGMDIYDTAGRPYESEDATFSARDSADNVITTMRDLEDFASLHFLSDEILAQMTQSVDVAAQPTGTRPLYRYELKLNSPDTQIRLFRDRPGSEPLAHVRNVTTASFLENNSSLDSAIGNTTTVLQSTVEADPDTRLRYLFEAFGQGGKATLEYTVTVTYPSPDGATSEPHTTTRTLTLDLDLRPIEDFYTRMQVPYRLPGGVDSRYDPFQPDDTAPQPDETAPHFEDAVARTTAKTTDAPFLNGSETVVMLHGWNMTDGTQTRGPATDWKKAFAETAFKRLYWQGFRGELVTFDWPTFADSEGAVQGETAEALNLSYNASEFQAWRSGQALMRFLDSRNNAGPVHLLAHSMGNVVAAEALRQWTVSGQDQPLVTNYVAMQGALSAGAYGDDAHDGLVGAGTSTDFYRYWASGVANEDSIYFMDGTGAAAGRWINMYNPVDAATTGELTGWVGNNRLKPLAGDIWRDVTLADPFEEARAFFYYYGTNGELFRCYANAAGERTDDGLIDLRPWLVAQDSQLPGPAAYEIMAFMARANSTPIGTKEVDFFDTNIDINLLGLPLELATRWPGHSFQFHFDAATTSQFWSRLVAETGMDTVSTPRAS